MLAPLTCSSCVALAGAAAASSGVIAYVSCKVQFRLVCECGVHLGVVGMVGCAVPHVLYSPPVCACVPNRPCTPPSDLHRAAAHVEHSIRLGGFQPQLAKQVVGLLQGGQATGLRRTLGVQDRTAFAGRHIHRDAVAAVTLVPPRGPNHDIHGTCGQAHLAPAVAALRLAGQHRDPGIVHLHMQYEPSSRRVSMRGEQGADQAGGCWLVCCGLPKQVG